MKKQKEQEKEYHTDGQEELDLVGGRVAYKVKENLEKIGGIVSGENTMIKFSVVAYQITRKSVVKKMVKNELITVRYHNKKNHLQSARYGYRIGGS